MKARILAEENRKWWTLVSVAFALFMIMLDNTVVNVALPSIRRDLGISLSSLEWVVSGYALSFAVLMLTGGKLADMFGRRRIFIIGLLVFALASLACGLATGAAFLIVARVVQGVGAAFMLPATLSIITATFPPKERGTALGIWAGVSAVALAIGPLVGGLIAEHIGWNWIFYINVPVGLLGIVAALVVIRESKDMSHEQRLDAPGLIASGVAFFAVVFALIESSRYGWGSATILGLFALAVVAIVMFVAVESRQRLPMFDLGLFRNGTFVGANIVALLVTLAMFGVFFFISLYMQNVRGYSAVEAGATFLPMTLLIIFLAPVAGRFSDRLGSRGLMSGGMTLTAVSLLLFARLEPHSSFWVIFPALIVGGAGMALVMTPMTAAAMSAVPINKAGVGSGMLNTFRQVGGALGIAVMGAILSNRQTAQLHAGATRVEAFMSGLHEALYVGAAVAFGAALVAAALIRSHAVGDTSPREVAVAAEEAA
jgi:EmrB/QacA subfamily drug resistance transporter